MLTLIESPDHFTPSVQGRPLRYVVRHPELILHPAQVSRYVFTVTSTGQAGQFFTLRGEEFRTDTAERYTADAFNPVQSEFLAAINLLGMLRRAPAFRNYRVRTNRDERRDTGADWQVIAEAAEITDDDPVAAENDVSALTGVELFYQPGRTEQRADERLYYRV